MKNFFKSIILFIISFLIIGFGIYFVTKTNFDGTYTNNKLTFVYIGFFVLLIAILELISSLNLIKKKKILKDTYFMWDLDGTLIDSYKVIVSSIKEVLNERNIDISYEVIKKESTEHSVGEFLTIISQEYNLSFKELEKSCHAHIDSRYLEVEAIKNAKEILDYLSSNGAKHFIYTHKGKSTHDILKNLDMYQYFEEVLTIEDGFKRKPDPEAINYLIKKYIMNKNNTYYIGDRHLDIDSANNAGIKSIFFKPEDSFVEPSGREDYVVHDLIEIKDIFK